MSIRHRALLLVALATAGSMTLASCARQISPNVHEGVTVGEVQTTYAGTIQQARVVQVQENDLVENNRTGQLIGGVAGGAAASRIGQGIGKAVAIGAGALIGATAGAFAEQELKRQTAMEYVVRTDSGHLLTVVQGLSPQYSPGQRVYVQESARGRGRIVPAA